MNRQRRRPDLDSTKLPFVPLPVVQLPEPDDDEVEEDDAEHVESAVADESSSAAADVRARKGYDMKVLQVARHTGQPKIN